MYPAGPDWWIDQFAEVQLTEDRWIKSMEIKPSNPKIVHHVVVYVIEPDAPEGTPETGVQLHEYGVGKFGDIFGENTGRLLKKGTRLRYDMHYFAIGSEQHNKTTIAFKFYPKGVVPKYQVRSLALRNIPNDELEVPPNTVVRTDGYFRLPRNARIDAFQPHMHMRGRGLTLEAINPVNNTTQILSSVDHFDFNWHINYVYADEEAPLLPAGTVLHMIGIHDNTSANRRNPDPNMWVGFGERSVDDMLQVWVNVVYSMTRSSSGWWTSGRRSPYRRRPPRSPNLAVVKRDGRRTGGWDRVPGSAPRPCRSCSVTHEKRDPSKWIFPKGHVERAETAPRPPSARRGEEAEGHRAIGFPSAARLGVRVERTAIPVDYFLIRADRRGGRRRATAARINAAFRSTRRLRLIELPDETGRPAARRGRGMTVRRARDRKTTAAAQAASATSTWTSRRRSGVA